MESEVEREAEERPFLLRFLFGGNPAWTVFRILFLIFVTIVLFKFVLVPIKVTGHSMYPTYKNGEIEFVNRLAYFRNPPQRFDVVAAQFAGNDVVLLKRVVALPGETFQVVNGDIYINGDLLPEPYAYGKIPDDFAKKARGTSRIVILEPKQYILMGDNRPLSELFPKYEHQIIGKVL